MIKPITARRPRCAAFLTALCLVVAITGCTAEVTVGGHADGVESKSRIEVATAMEKVFPALVRIYVVIQEPEGGRMRRMQAAGSGAIISKDGHVVTNHHVAGDATRIVCSLPDREEIEATLVGSDPLADIAVLKLKLDQRRDKTIPLPVAQWGDSDKLDVGDTVLAMGSPVAVSQSVTRGIVSNTQLIMPQSFAGDFMLDGENVGSIVRWIAHDAAIYHGNSGGPLVNLQGQIVGVNEMGLGNLSGAIPSNLARMVADEIIRTGHVSRSWIGLETQPRLKSDSRTAGVLVAGVVPNSPAAKAGLTAGDLVTNFRGSPINVAIAEQWPLFNQLVLSTPIGSTVDVAYERNGKSCTTQITTVARQREIGEPSELKDWGITVRPMTRDMALENHRPDTRGVYIDSVRNGGAMADAKLALNGGDIIVAVDGKPTDDPESLRKITEAITTGKTTRTPVLVRFDRRTEELLTVIKIGRDEPKDKPAVAKKPWSGLTTQVVTTDVAEALKLGEIKGVRITEVHQGYAGEKAGLHVGDILTAMDGIPIEASQPEDSEVFATMVRKYDLGTEAKLKLLRDGKPMEIAILLDAPPRAGEKLKAVDNTDFEFAARDMTFQDRVRLKLPEDMRGVLIERVEPAGWAALGGLHPDDTILSVDGKPTASALDLKAILAQARVDKPRRLAFLIRRGIHTHFHEVEPDWK